MKLDELCKCVSNKNNFETVKSYSEFCADYLNFIHDNLQAVIVSQNETNYRFFQYKEDGNYNVTRPINSDLFITLDEFDKSCELFESALTDIKECSNEECDNFNRHIYTCQQSIGAALDALPVGKSNTARKLNGDLFERYIRLLLRKVNVDVSDGFVSVPIIENGKKIVDMTYQHDLIVKKSNELRAIGSVKTSSKDRIDKIFVDKFLYNRLTNNNIPHFAVFLNDVQRKNGLNNKYGVNATFLAGHFMGYTIRLNPLDGVYYCDLRPNMKTDEFLKQHIKTLDKLFTDDIWKLINHSDE